jgi:hypothetical protein
MPSHEANEPSSGSGWVERGFDAVTIVAADNQISSDCNGEAVILELGKGVYYGLNPVGTCVWELIRDPISATKLRDALLERFDVDQNRCEVELIALLDEMSSRGLIAMTRHAHS